MIQDRVATASLLILLGTASPVLAQSPCDSPRATCVRAVDALSRSYEECQDRNASHKDLFSRCQAQLNSYKRMRENVDALVQHYEALRETSTSLVDKQEQMLGKSKQIEGLLSQSLDLSNTSVRELDAALVDLNKKYNTCVRDCMAPFYESWEFWAGVAGGALLGALGTRVVWDLVD